MIRSDPRLTPADLLPSARLLFELSGRKILKLHHRWDPTAGTPVFTVAGKYTARGWTEWTQGFQFGSALLQFEATGEEWFLHLARAATVDLMAPHVSHVGVHDHGFNNVSTYGTLLRMMAEGVVPEDAWERRFHELALKLSGAVQASRWTQLTPTTGYVYSFNGPHSLFADTIRSMRALAVAHLLGHRLMGEGDKPVDLLDRLIQHADATSRHNVYFGPTKDAAGGRVVRDAYDVRGRCAHESIFNLNDGAYRCPSSQQGYSPFSTWTRGLAWILCGYPEQLEFLRTLPEDGPLGAAFARHGGKAAILARFLATAEAVADFYLDHTPTDGVPYWDTGAPGLAKLGDYLYRPADPFNDHEPVDSSAAVIAAQGLLRLGRYLKQAGGSAVAAKAARYWQAGLTVARTALAEPYLSADPEHEGLVLHSVYHRPNGWDYVPPGRKVPCGESSMWGDYHARELALLIKREAEGKDWLAFHTVVAKNPG
jgi:unsaturated chondroitin disaccharide hydrolase